MNRIVYFINKIFVGLLLLTYLSPLISPNSFWPLAFLGLAYPIFLAINMAFILFWFLRKRKNMLLSILVIALGWSNLSKLCAFHLKGAVPEDSIAIMSFNAHNFNTYKNWSKPNLKLSQQKILHFLKSENPAILCLQEYSMHSKTDSIQRIANYLESETNLKYQFEGQRNLIVYSRFPIVNSGDIPFNNSKNSAIFVDLKIEDKTVRVFNLHLQSIKLGKDARAILNKDKLSNLNEKTTQRFYKSVLGRLKHAFQRRADQVKIIRNYINNSPYPVIVCGDFNDTPVSYAYRMLSENLQDSFSKAGYGIGSTYSGPLPGLRIDYILAAPEFKIFSHSIHKKNFSDHFAVSSSIKFQE